MRGEEKTAIRREGQSSPKCESICLSEQPFVFLLLFLFSLFFLSGLT